MKQTEKRDRQPLESGQTEKWLDYAAHSLQNIGQALQPPELLDTYKQAKRAYK